MTTQTEIQVREIQARAARDEIRRLKAEIERLKAKNLKNVRAYSEELEKRVPPTEIRFINRDGSEAGRIVNLAPPSEQTYCPECGQPGECACLGNWRERAERAEAEVERIACAATGLKQCCEEQRAEVERLRRLCTSHASVYGLLVEYFGGNLRGEQQTLHHRLSSIVRVAEMRAEKAEADLERRQR
jgi:hypothetical protein